MSTDARFIILISAISLVFTVLCVLLGLITRIIVKWTRTEDKLSVLTEDVKEIINDKEKVHVEMYRQMREDRAATDKRLRWLEIHVWTVRGNPSPDS